MATTTPSPQPAQVLVPAETSNAEFLQRYAAPGRVGLVGLHSFVDRRIRRSQRRLHPDRLWSLWSHAFLFEGERLDGRHWLLESDLSFSGHFLRLGVQENRIDKYFEAEEAPALAVLDFGLDAGQARQVIGAGLDLLGSGTRYSIPKVLGSYVALRRRELGRTFTRADERSLYCSAFVVHCFAAAGLDLVPGVPADNALPELLASSPVPHRTWLLHRLDPK